MRYIARLIPARNPLQASCHGESLRTLRLWAQDVIPSGSSARVEVYENLEVKHTTFTKQMEGDKYVITETPACAASGATERVAAELKEPGDETVTGEKRA